MNIHDLVFIQMGSHHQGVISCVREQCRVKESTSDKANNNTGSGRSNACLSAVGRVIIWV